MSQAIKTKAPANVKKLFHLSQDFELEIFNEPSELVPDIDKNYVFDENTTKAILAGFKFNKRVLLQGYHGTGKSTHIEQIAARLNWQCIRVNLDGNITRMDLIGRDVINLRDGKQVTEFQEGVVPFAVRRPVALVLDEYDAGRPDVMFIIQRLLEQNGKFNLLDKNEVITPHVDFRIFATANTVGLGDDSGIYHGTSLINQGQLDRWDIVANLDYLSQANEEKIIKAKFGKILKAQEIKEFVAMANLTRQAFKAGEISTLMSVRTVLSWAANMKIFGSIAESFKYAFFNRCDFGEREIIAEMYQRVFGEEL
jgi:cobaltochelatase CobS